MMVREMEMAEPLTFMGVKAGTAVAIGGGSLVASLLMHGQPWHVRMIAGFCGCVAATIFTPILSPLAVALWVNIYAWLGVDPALLPRASIDGFVGFATGLTGIDICRWIIERTKFGLHILRFPPWKKGSKGD